MAVAYLTRVVRFSATHRYFKPAWPAERNAATFGSTVHEHGHEYRCEVTIRGTPDPDTGMVIDLGALDRLLSEEVVKRFDQRRLHLDVPEFADGKDTPTGEMICIDIFRRIAARMPAGCSVARVRVAEDETLWSDYKGE